MQGGESVFTAVNVTEIVAMRKLTFHPQMF